MMVIFRMVVATVISVTLMLITLAIILPFEELFLILMRALELTAVLSAVAFIFKVIRRRK